MKQKRRMFRLVLGALGGVATASAWTSTAWAQTTTRTSNLAPETIVWAVVSTLLFGLIGVALAIVGFKLFDAATPFNLEQEICEKQNIAAAILSGAMVLGICLIIAATVLS